MTVKAWCNIVPASMRLGLKIRSRGEASIFTGAAVYSRAGGDIWIATLEFRELNTREWMELAGFLASLGGRTGAFALPDYTCWNQGGAGGQMYLTGNANATTATIVGVTGPSPHFKRGDRF
ncbi:MAG: hypothetical protein NZM12_12215, partial [Steroidobacteraceae bacterium]|nr:hypothetical protein [Steroidobacteraceae bacterium]